MLRLLVITCCVLAVAFASKADDNGNSELLSLLKKFLHESDKRLSTGACETANGCNGGLCNDSEDPWGLGFYCTRCPDGYGGLTCDVEDPCNTNPCPDASDTCYGPVSMDPLGRWCYATRNAQLVSRVLRKLEEGEMMPSEMEPLLRSMKSSNFDDSLTTLKRALE